PIPAVPLTANGKLNRKALPEPAPARTAAAPLPPATEVERELIDIWRRFLKVHHVEASDDFFDLGGHSLLATQAINSIDRHYVLNVPVRLLFENPTVKTLAAALSAFEDEVWLDESKHATAILTRSKRRVLQSAAELSEEQIDDFLMQHFEELDIVRFE